MWNTGKFRCSFYCYSYSYIIILRYILFSLTGTIAASSFDVQLLKDEVVRTDVRPCDYTYTCAQIDQQSKYYSFYPKGKEEITSTYAPTWTGTTMTNHYVFYYGDASSSEWLQQFGTAAEKVAQIIARQQNRSSQEQFSVQHRPVLIATQPNGRPVKFGSKTVADLIGLHGPTWFVLTKNNGKIFDGKGTIGLAVLNDFKRNWSRHMGSSDSSDFGSNFISAYGRTPNNRPCSRSSTVRIN